MGTLCDLHTRTVLKHVRTWTRAAYQALRLRGSQLSHSYRSRQSAPPGHAGALCVQILPLPWGCGRCCRDSRTVRLGAVFHPSYWQMRREFVKLARFLLLHTRYGSEPNFAIACKKPDGVKISVLPYVICLGAEVPGAIPPDVATDRVTYSCKLVDSTWLPPPTTNTIAWANGCRALAPPGAMPVPRPRGCRGSIYR